ncbi:uncharacterized protein LOC119318324 isoform X4 [Triticum dicoccoides]|nr:uncharacterized protein LOC119318324 isoform X4 [Triticum dicoccoides]
MPASCSSSSPRRQALACGCAPPPAAGRNIGEVFSQSMHMPRISPSGRRMTVSDELRFLLGNQASEFIPAVIKANQGFSASRSQSRSRMYARSAFCIAISCLDIQHTKQGFRYIVVLQKKKKEKKKTQPQILTAREARVPTRALQIAPPATANFLISQSQVLFHTFPRTRQPPQANGSSSALRPITTTQEGTPGIAGQLQKPPSLALTPSGLRALLDRRAFSSCGLLGAATLASPSPLRLRRYIDYSREEPYGPRPRFEPWRVPPPSGPQREADSFGNGFLDHDWPEYSREGNYGTPTRFLELADSFPGQSRFERGRGDDFRRPNRSLPRSPMDWDLPRGHSPFFADEHQCSSSRPRDWTPALDDRRRRGSSPPGRHEGRGHVQSRDDTFYRSGPFPVERGRGDGFEATPRPRFSHGAMFPERSPAIILEGERRWTPSPQDRRRGALFPGSDGHDPWTQRSMERLGQQSSPRGDRGGSFLETGDRGEPYPLGPPPPHNLGGGRGGFPPRRFFRGRGGLQQTGPPGGSGRQRSPRQSSVLPALRTEPEASGGSGHQSSVLPALRTGPEASGGSRRKAFPRKRLPRPVRGVLSEKQVAGAIKSTGVEEPQRPSESKHDDSNGAVRPEAANYEGKIKPEATVDEGDGTITSGLIVGMCTDVQKGYFRLTGPPDATKIRPKLVLVEALKFVQVSSKDYNFKTDQLKSIRQDMTIQNIEDELSVQVYEYHARLALCNRDMAELNLCLTKLHCLYGNKRNGGHHGEFAAYDILLSAIQDKNTELMSKLGRLSSDLKQQETVKHAKEVAHSIQTGNYASFFKLYKVAPNLNGYLM